MATHTSSAVPQALFRYAEVAQSLNDRIDNEARLLGAALQRLAATCTEYSTGASPELADALRGYVRRLRPNDTWVRQVGEAFQRADGGAPRDMADLALSLNKQQERVRIVQIGPNEYMIMLKGVELTRDRHNDLTAAIQSGSGIPSDYERQVLDLIRQNVPPGANVHFATHSLGGIVANNLADNQDFLDDYHVRTVTTFGSPVSARPNPDVIYTRFRNASDPVPTFNPELIDPNTRNEANVAYLSQIPVDSGKDGFEAHDESEYAKGLEAIGRPPLPTALNITQWDVKGEYSSVRQSTPTEDMITASGQLVIHDVATESGKTVALGAANHVVDEVLELPLPEELRDEVDRYRDRANHAIAGLPTPTEAAGAVIDEAAEQGRKVKDLVDDAAPVINEVVEKGKKIKDLLDDALPS